ncbi:DUF4169 family protein [Novosphingobium sp. BL-52-GroH]|uniref:DUF4169 family protein n=1 Tax=Novosphingobium sp. BL-52-GroH TaxID=3349877 RepID=UPI00384DD988
MAEIINLRMARKTRARTADKAQAEQNRAKHGRTKGERLVTAAEVARIDRVLDGARRERDGANAACENGDAPPENGDRARQEADATRKGDTSASGSIEAGLTSAGPPCGTGGN